jgi:hypothetical protein
MLPSKTYLPSGSDCLSLQTTTPPALPWLNIGQALQRVPPTLS